MTPAPRNLSEVSVTFINTDEQLMQMKQSLARADRVSIDTETHAATSFDNGLWSALRIISVAARAQTPDGTKYRSWVIDYRDVSDKALQDAFSGVSEAYAWNANFDELVLGQIGLTFPFWYDAMLAEAVLSAGTAGRSFYLSLAHASAVFLGIDMIGKGTTQLSYDGESDLTDEQKMYPAQDAIVTLWNSEEIETELAKAGLVEVALREMKARPFIQEMTKQGFNFDSAGWASFLETHRKAHAGYLAHIAELTGADPETDFDLKDAKARAQALADAELEGKTELAQALKLYEVQLQTALDAAAKVAQLISGQSMNILTIVGEKPDFDLDADNKLIAALKKHAKAAVKEVYGSANGLTVKVGIGLSELKALAEKSEFAQACYTYRKASAENKDTAASISLLSGGKPRTPNFKVTSDPQLRDALNKYALSYVEDFTGGREFIKGDSINKDTLKALTQAGCELAEAVGKFRVEDKLLSTYGDKMLSYAANSADGRIHPQYKQGIVATGRLSSLNPNAQNMHPESKQFIQAPPGRVLIQADYSQAEVRAIAQEANDVAMIAAFESGADFHTATAGSMFNVEMEKLLDEDPETFGTYRSSAKKITFGMPYGKGPSKLAHELTLEGNETSIPVAKSYIEDWMAAYPQVASYLRNRDDRVKNLSENLPSIDWNTSIKLLELWDLAEKARKDFKRANHAFPSWNQLAKLVKSNKALIHEMADQLGRVPLMSEIRARRKGQADKLAWAFASRGVEAPVVLLSNGQPFALESRTPGARRRLFHVTMDSRSTNNEADRGGGESGWASKAGDPFSGVITSAMLEAAADTRPHIAAARAKWVAANGIELPAPAGRDWTKRMEHRKESVAAFKGEAPKKLAFVQSMGSVWPGGINALLSIGMKDQVRMLKNAYRNHPIQGVVADIVEDSMADIWETLKRFDQAFPVQSVHDSIVLECWDTDAEELAVELKQILEATERGYFPNVPCKADVEIRKNLGKKGVLATVGDDWRIIYV